MNNLFTYLLELNIALVILFFLNVYFEINCFPCDFKVIWNIFLTLIVTIWLPQMG